MTDDNRLAVLEACMSFVLCAETTWSRLFPENNDHRWVSFPVSKKAHYNCPVFFFIRGSVVSINLNQHGRESTQRSFTFEKKTFALIVSIKYYQAKL